MFTNRRGLQVWVKFSSVRRTIVKKLWISDEHAVGVYKFESDDAETMLVGHVSIELSMLLSRFLKASEKNVVEVKVCGKRRRKAVLVIPGHYKARTKSRSHCKILDRELNYMKTKYSHFEIEHELSEERIPMPYVTSSK